MEIDRKQLQSILDIDPTGELCQRLLTIFEAEIPELLYELGRSLHEENLHISERIVHSMKSSSLNIGASHLAKKCEELEKKFSEKKKQSDKVLVELKETFEYTVPRLREFVSLQSKK